MSIESRIQALEDFFDPGSDKRVEEECQERMKFHVKFALWSRYVDLSEAQRLSLDQAWQRFKALPPLPKHRCTPAQPVDDETRVRLRCLVEKALAEPMTGAAHIRGSAEDVVLWERFAPGVPFPWQRDA